MVLKGGRKSRHRRTKHKRHHKRKHKRRTKHRRHRMKGGGRPGIAPLNGSPAAPFNEKWGGPAPAGWSSGTRNVLDEVWTIGGTFNNGTSVTNHHKGAIHFRVVADTECEISSGNIQKGTLAVVK